MVTAVSTTINPKAQKAHQYNPTRPPLLPSDPENVLASRRPKAREVTSRYLSTSSSAAASSASAKRCLSPLVSRTIHSPAMTSPSQAITSTVKRSQSVESRRPATARSNSLDLRLSNGNNGELSAAQKLLTSSTRSFSVSFQGESFSLQVSKAKQAPSPSVARKGTPERRRLSAATTSRRAADHTENSKVERWPGRSRQAISISRSVDYTDERKKLIRSGGSNVVRALQNSMVDSRVSLDTILSSGSSNADLQKKDEEVVGDAGGSDVQCDPVPSDNESVSSGSTSGAQESNCNDDAEGKRGPRGIVVPARFWQETNNRLRRQQEPGSSLLKKTPGPPKLIVPKKFGLDSPVSSPKGGLNSRAQLWPTRGLLRPASPSKLGVSPTTSPLRGVSPSRVRNGLACGLNGDLNNTQSILSFAADVKRGKIGDNRVFDAQLLRPFYNRLLQWRFVNARADAALSAQTLNAEKSLYNALITTSKLRESVRIKRTELQVLRQNSKLISILRAQMEYLDEWALMDNDYPSSLLGATEALRGSILRLPVVGGARVDVQKVKHAIYSAVNVLQAMSSSMHSLVSKVGEANSLVTELANVSAKERALLDDCRDLMSTIAAMQVTECSLRTHILQLGKISSA